MFYGCSNLAQQECGFPALVDGTNMFSGCSGMRFFKDSTAGNFAALKIGTQMFYGCSSLTDLSDCSFPNLQEAQSMFELSGITSISCNFPSVTNGRQMFCECGVTNLSLNCPQQFPALTDCTLMFGYCNNLTTLSFDVSNISNGLQMFGQCRNLTTCTGASFANGGDY